MTGKQIPNRRRVDVDEVQRALEENESPELYAQLEEFGRLLITDSQAHTSAIESKGLSVLGWTSALLALAFSKDLALSVAASWPLLMMTGLGVVSAFVALASAARCVKPERWSVPSQQDWMRTDLFHDLPLLRRYQILSLLENYDTHCRRFDPKARALEIAQPALVIAATLLGVVLIVSVFVAATNPVGTPGGNP